MPNSGYHKEIDGLRAIAVLVIIFFHMKIPGFRGGFIGVDVFFVLSGFLITQIIVSSLETGQFSFRDFYIRRVTRIIPALAVTVAAVLLCSLYLQQPQALVHTAQQSIYALLSVSNMFFWSESNYWAPSAEKFTLLHTWSLGVEEQFYLVYPLILFVAHRLGGLRGVVTLLLLTLVCGYLCQRDCDEVSPCGSFLFRPSEVLRICAGRSGNSSDAANAGAAKNTLVFGCHHAVGCSSHIGECDLLQFVVALARCLDVVALVRRIVDNPGRAFAQRPLTAK